MPLKRVGLAVLGAGLAILPVRAVEVDGIVANVGETTILRSDVQNELRRYNPQNAPTFEEALNEMIDRKLILRAAQESKMTMQEWVVESRVREVIHRAFGGDRNKLIETLGQQKVSYPEWYAKTKEDMIIGAMRWNVVDKNVAPSPSAMREEYKRHPEKYATNHTVSVSVILLKPEERGKRDEISAALKEKDFAELGGKKYENVNASDLFKPEIVEEIEKMPRGTISHWIELSGWSFLLRKDAETEGKRLTFEEAYDAIYESVKSAESKRLYGEWIERLRSETYIKIF